MFVPSCSFYVHFIGRVRRGCLRLLSFYYRETYHRFRAILESHFFHRESYHYPRAKSENHLSLVENPLSPRGYPENHVCLENVFF